MAKEIRVFLIFLVKRVVGDGIILTAKIAFYGVNRMKITDARAYARDIGNVMRCG